MNLYCCEEERIIRAHFDPVILEDPRVVRRLLEIENQYVVRENYFVNIQDEITPEMKKVCLTWLLEVSEAEKCESSVFQLAVNYMDRYLALARTSKKNLQLLGCVCLMLASKLRQTKPLGSAVLSAYTCFTYSAQQIVDFETDMLNTLKWNLSSVIPYDYLDTVVYRLPDCQKIQHLVLGHAKTFQELSLLEFEFTAWPPSLIALSTIGTAIRGLPNVKDVWPHVDNLVDIFYDMTNLEHNSISNCIDSMEAFINAYITRAQQAENNSHIVNKHNDDNSNYDPDTPPATPPDLNDIRI